MQADRQTSRQFYDGQPMFVGGDKDISRDVIGMVIHFLDGDQLESIVISKSRPDRKYGNKNQFEFIRLFVTIH